MSEQKTSDVKKIGGLRFASMREGTFAIGFNGYDDDSIMSTFVPLTESWEDYPVNVAGVRLIPWGPDNSLPTGIRRLLEKNNLAPGIIDREIGLTYGQGPQLYQLEVKKENNEIVRAWVDEPEVQAWLDSWDYRLFIRNALTEYKYLRGVFAKMIPAGRTRTGTPWINRIVCLPSSDCRMEWIDSRNPEDVQRIWVGDFERNLGRFEAFPVFRKYQPIAKGAMVGYFNFRNFARNFYSLPSFYGSIPWIRRSNDIPEIIAYLTDNMIAAAYHVHEPSGYWNGKRERLMELNKEWDEIEIENAIDSLRDEFAASIARVLAGKKNAGKFLTTVDFYDDEGNPCSWKIEPIEMNINNYIDAQAKISKIADSATTSGIGLHPSLSNIIIDGQLNSGSQLLYALKLYLIGDTSIPEEIVCDAINSAIAINFPGKKCRIGFYHQVVMKEENVAPKDRVSNNA